MLKRQKLTLRQAKGALTVARILFALFFLALFAGSFVLPAHASLTLLIGEPFDTFGTLLPVGHATLYLDRVCADGPLRVRMCRPDEQAGVAISRYNNIGAYDWLATPITQFLYATDRPQDALPYTTKEAVAGLREEYRRAFLNDLFPDGTEVAPKNSEWWESAGMAYTRRLWGYRIATTREQDERFVEALNASPNHHAYGAYHSNCANFAARWINFYYPGLVRRNRWADLGFLLPKQIARCLYYYGKIHPEAQVEVIEIPQIPGSIHRSHTVRGGAETFLKTKRYVFPLAIVQPEIAVSLFALYLDHGGWKVARRATHIVGPESFVAPAESIEAAN